MGLNSSIVVLLNVFRLLLGVVMGTDRLGIVGSLIVLVDLELLSVVGDK